MPTPPTHTAPKPKGTPQSLATTFGWAAYLACSWTWCIGMFLPVLLVRDFGIWGFVVFAVPNVVGAGAMGWVLRNGAAERIAEAHPLAVRAFSEVTWLFHLFFFCWLVSSNPSPTLIAAIAAVAAFLLTSWLVPRWFGHLSWPIVAFVISAAVFAACGSTGQLQLPSAGARLPATHIVWLAPVCLMGFALCPYLDATFLRARKEQAAQPARTSFAFGFGVLFAAMIAFTLLYAGLFQRDGAPIRFVQPAGVAAVLVAAHMVFQIAFTNQVHGMAMARRESGAKRGLMAGVLIVALMAVSRIDAVHAGLTVGEITYRLFMSFYGLVFPAYVWLCMIPVRGERGTQAPGERKLVVFAVAVVLAAPCYWMGFIERQTWWLGPGVGIVLVARLFLPRKTAAYRTEVDQ